VVFLSSPDEPHPDVLILSVNEETLAGLQYRQPLDRAFLANALKVLDEAQPRVIGVDVLLDQATEADKDAVLKAQLANMRTPLFAAFATEPDGLTPQQAAYLEDFVPLQQRSTINLARDSYDGVVRSSAGSLVERLHPAGVTPEVLYLGLSSKLLGFWDGSVKKYPIHQIHKLPQAWLKDKIILIGAELSLTDRYPSSWTALLGQSAGSMPGVEFHAHAVINRIMGKGYWRAKPWVQTVGIAIMLLLALTLAYSELQFWAKGVLSVGLGLLWLIIAVQVMGAYNQVLMVFTPLVAMVLGGALGGVARGMQYRKERQFIRQAMSHYVAPKLVQALQKNPALLRLGGERRKVAMMFTDIAGFTSLSECMPAEDLIRNLNEYLHGVSELVAKHGGIVDKYIGDAVVALFNTPVEQPDYATQALKCALAVDEFAEQFRRDLQRLGWAWGITRLGLHVDDVVVGNVGGRKRFDYTAMGDGMNTASRMEGVNGYTGTRLMVSQAVLDVAEQPTDVALFEVANIHLKGKKKGIACFTFLHETQEIHAQYNQALLELKAGNLELAYSLFQQIPLEAECAGLCAFHIQRIKMDAKMNPNREDVDWTSNSFEPGGKTLAES
jgi:class 3 adenylate cyclase